MKNSRLVEEISGNAGARSYYLNPASLFLAFSTSAFFRSVSFQWVRISFFRWYIDGGQVIKKELLQFIVCDILHPPGRT